MPRSLIILLVILIIDQVNSGMMQPILPLLFTDPESPALMIGKADAETTGMILIAVMGAAYAVPAFFMQPIIGQLADRYGRRPLLIASFVSSTLSFFVFAAGISLGMVWLVIVGRVIDGLAAGNMLVAQASVADVSEEESRTQYFGFLTAALSLGFVVGPSLGGYLGSPETGDWAGPATAFYVSGAANAIIVIAFAFLFKETLKDKDRSEGEGFELARSFKNSKEAFQDKSRRPYYLILLCYIAGYTFFTTFYSVVLEEDLEMDAQQTGYFFSALGLALMVVQLLLVKRFEDWFGPRKSLWLAMFTVGGAVLLMGLAQEPWMAYAGIIPFALAAGLIDPMIMSLLSKSASNSEQGRIQGVRGSVDSLGRTFPPFLAGPLAAAGAANWAVLAGAGVMVVGGVAALRLLAETDQDGQDDPEQRDSGDGDDDGPRVVRKQGLSPEPACDSPEG